MVQCDPTTLSAFLRESLSGGGSGRGLTFWGEASRCGKQALLKEQSRDKWKEDPASAPAFDLSKTNAFAVGGVYHKLHELWDDGLLSDECLSKVGVSEDASVNLGIHLFRGWKAHWGKGYWGLTVDSEVQLPASEYAARELKHRFGEVINAKPDRVVNITEGDLEVIRRRCPAITEPGYYMVDFKTAGSDYDEVYYHEGMQSYWYPYVWNLDFPGRKVKGFIYDIIIKPNSRAKDQTVDLINFPPPVFVPLRSEEVVERVLNGLFRQGRENIERQLGNRSECIKIQFGKVEPCPFFQKACHGY